MASGQENTSYINNIKMTDKVSPDEIILSYLQGANKTTVNWKNRKVMEQNMNLKYRYIE